jgi:hypothetical protein
MGSYRLDEEYKVKYPHRSGQWSIQAVQAGLAVIQMDRDCPKFIQWTPALTPKEHVDMLATREMLDAQAARLDAQAVREREWRKEDVERDHQRRNEDIAMLKADMKVKGFAPLIGAVVGALITAFFVWVLRK